MNPREIAIKALQEKGEVVIRCNGNSMRPLIGPKEAIHLKKVDLSLIRVDDAVFVRVNKNLQVHKVGAIDKNRFRIENNKGFVNGWVGPNAIYGLACKIEDRVLVSDEELAKRKAENEKQKYDPFDRDDKRTTLLLEEDIKILNKFFK